MSGLSRFWKMWQIVPAAEGRGYRGCELPIAQPFFQAQPFAQADRAADLVELSNRLFHHFLSAKAPLLDRAYAGLCLRCYVSAPILHTCKKIAHLFGGSVQFNYRDLLPFVLTDDGQILGVLENGQVVGVSEQGNFESLTYQPFSFKILQSFEPDAPSRMSLENWAYFKTKQNPEIKAFLSEYGFQHLSDWALLNRIRKNQLERLSESDRQLIDAFHAVYRRDRRQQERQRTKCPVPSAAQLAEMANLLGDGLSDALLRRDREGQILSALQQIATQLRQYDVWSSREPLEVYDSETEAYQPRADLMSEAADEMEMEKGELRSFLVEEFRVSLNQAIARSVGDRLTALTRSKTYAAFASQLIPGLQLYYGQGLSLKDIAPQLKMTSWDQARRILNPGELLSRVRALTVQQVLHKTLEKATQMGLTRDPPTADYLKTLVEQIEAFADAEIFQRAAEELRAGKSRAMTSLYAQALRSHLQHLVNS
jgi:hypothetical protein